LLLLFIPSSVITLVRHPLSGVAIVTVLFVRRRVAS
jgi:hypothetical protein